MNELIVRTQSEIDALPNGFDVYTVVKIESGGAWVSISVRMRSLWQQDSGRGCGMNLNKFDNYEYRDAKFLRALHIEPFGVIPESDPQYLVAVEQQYMRAIEDKKRDLRRAQSEAAKLLTENYDLKRSLRRWRIFAAVAVVIGVAIVVSLLLGELHQRAVSDDIARSFPGVRPLTFEPPQSRSDRRVVRLGE